MTRTIKSPIFAVLSWVLLPNFTLLPAFSNINVIILENDPLPPQVTIRNHQSCRGNGNPMGPMGWDEVWWDGMGWDEAGHPMGPYCILLKYGVCTL